MSVNPSPPQVVSMQSRRDKEKRMREAEIAIIVEERGIWQGIGISRQK